LKQDNLDPTESNYRWVVLTLGAITNTIVIAMPSMAMPVLFEEISKDLGLSLVQIGAIWGMGSLTGIFTGLISGTISDRYGTRRTIMISCILLGIVGALRGFASDFAALSAIVLVYGFLTPAIPTNIHKVCGVWFPKRQMGLANGIAAMGMAFGFMIGSMISATVLSPLLGGWRNVLILYGVLAVFMGGLWHFTRSTPKDSFQPSSESRGFSIREGLSQTIRIRRIWLLGLVLMGFGGCIQGTLGYLPLYLRGIGWPETSADGALASFHASSMLFVIPLALLSDRLGKRKPILLVIAFSTTLAIGFLSIIHGPLVWGLVILTGVTRDGFMAIFMTAVIETRKLETYTLGTALGLVRILSSIGGLISPPLGNSLANISLSTPFLFWGGLAAIALVSLIFIKE
jgi:MFS family permease